MLKKLAAFVGLIALAICSTAGSLNIRNLAGNQRADLITGRTDQSSTRYPWTDAEYLERGRYQPNGGLAIILANSDSTYVSNAIAQVDSIFFGRGVYADTGAIIGQRIRLTICVDPESTQVTRVGAATHRHLTIAEVQALAARTPDVEVAVTGSEKTRLGWRGMQSAYNATGSRVTGANQTGMKKEYINAVLTMWQDSTASWGILPFRTIRWPDDRYTPGIDIFMQPKGFYQGVRKALNLNTVTADFDISEEIGQDSPNYAPYATALMQGGGNNRWVGIHMIGEQINRYDKGARLWCGKRPNNTLGDSTIVGNDSNGSGATTPDSLLAWIDACVQGNNIGFLIVDGQVGASTSTVNGIFDITKAHFGTLCQWVAHRQAEDLIDTFTAEQAVARTRGIRDGDLINTHNFTVLDSLASPTVNYRNGAVGPSNLRVSLGSVTGGKGPVFAPIGLPLVTDWFINGSADSFAAHGNEVTTAPTVINLSVDTDSILSVYNGVTDSLSYGFASATGNVIMQGFQSTSQGRPLSMFIPTMGCDSRAIEVRLQYIYGPKTITFDQDSVVMCASFGQFTEKWDDHLDEGQSAYRLGVVLLRAGQTPDTSNTAFLPDSLIYKQRIMTQFAVPLLAMADTSRTGRTVGKWVGSATPADTCAKTFAGTIRGPRSGALLFRPSGAGTIGTTANLRMLVTDGIGKIDSLVVDNTYTPGTALPLRPSYEACGTVAFSAGAGAGLAVEAGESFIVTFGASTLDVTLGSGFTEGQNGWYREVLGLKTEGSSLAPVRIGFATGQADWGLRYTIGNPRTIKTGTIPAHTDPYIADLQSIRPSATAGVKGTKGGRIYNSFFKVPINENTDYVYGWVSPQLNGGTTSAAPTIYYLSISARPCS